MAKKQTRRSISINRHLYEQAKLCAASAGIPLSQLVEKGLHAIFGQIAAAPNEDERRAVLERIDRCVPETVRRAHPRIADILAADPDVAAEVARINAFEARR